MENPNCKQLTLKVYRKKNGMKEKRLYTDPDEVRRELQKVADKLGLPLNSCSVAMNGHNVATVVTSVFQMNLWQSCIFLLAAKTIIAFFITFFFIFYDFFLFSYNYIVRR